MTNRNSSQKQDRLVVMSMSIILILVAIILLTACTQKLDSGFSEKKLIAESWITHAPTYAYDGTELTFKSIVALESNPVQYELIYTFTSTHEGYGDRSGEILAQVLTTHEIRVLIQEGIVTSAIIDDEWDEYNQVFLSELRVPNTPTSPVQIANPASTYCIENGGKLEIRDSKEGQTGYCTLPNGKECEEWAYFRGECK